MADNEGFEVFTMGEEFYHHDQPKKFGVSDADPEGFEMTWGLIFLGTGPGILRIGYREYSDGSLRGPFSLELTVSLPSFLFRVQGERFEFSRVDNEGLSIRHLSPEGGAEG